MRLIRLTPDQFTPFDCGDKDVNDFLVEDAKPFLDKRIANTFILEDEGEIAAYYCILNDKISRLEIANSRWKSTIKYLLGNGQNLSAFRFITVDAYLSAVSFYEKNGFKVLTQKEEDEHTRLMYYDMMERYSLPLTCFWGGGLFFIYEKTSSTRSSGCCMERPEQRMWRSC